MTATELEYPRPRVATRDEWRDARIAFLGREKEITRAQYRFEGPTGPARLIDLFDGRQQLIVYHFMFLREKNEGCPGCSYMADNLPDLTHLRLRETNLVLVSRAPLAEIAPFQARMGWSTPWYSSFGSDFNYDFHVTIDEAVAPVEYNFRGKRELEQLGQLDHIKGEQPGASVFLRDGERVYHTYSTYGRGLDPMLSTHSWLDLTPFGRGEGWDGMPDLKVPLRLRDKYDA